MDSSRTMFVNWRVVAVVVSLAGLAAPAILPGNEEVEPSSKVSVFAVHAIPSALGLFAALVNITPRMRIVVLWLAALAAGFAGVITILSGPGIIMLGVMVAYLVVAWSLNETSDTAS